MIHNFLKLVVSELNEYLKSISQGDGPFAVAGNIGLATVFGGNESFLDNKVVVSITNLAEEPTLKNNLQYRYNSLAWEKEFPPIFLNVYFLFSANFNPPSSVASSDNNYYLGINRLCQVIEFFQGKPCLSVSNSSNQDSPTIDSSNIDFQNLTVKMEIVSLTFEQCNFLWSSLGGKQLPFVLYKAHIIPITRHNLNDGGRVITDVETIFNDFSDSSK